MRQDKPYPYSIHDSFDVNERPSKHYNGRIPANVYQNRTQIKRKEQTNMLQLGLASFNQSSLVEPNGKLAASDSDQPIVNEGTTEHISISSTSSCSASQTFSTESEVSGPSLQKSEQPKSDFRPANYKTRLCLKWEQMGECSFGDRCNFAHGRQELRHQFTSIEVSEAWRTQPQPIHTKAGSLKTRLCSKYHQFGICPYADKCKFAHGYQELASNLHCECSVGVSSPSAHQNYKTRLCMNWQDSGSCSFGDKCNFAHGHLELRGQGGGDVHGTQARPMFFCGVLGPPPLQALVPPHLACPQMCLPSMMPQLGTIPSGMGPVPSMVPVFPGPFGFVDQRVPVHGGNTIPPYVEAMSEGQMTSVAGINEGNITCNQVPLAQGSWCGPRWTCYGPPPQAGIYA